VIFVTRVTQGGRKVRAELSVKSFGECGNTDTVAQRVKRADSRQLTVDSPNRRDPAVIGRATEFREQAEVAVLHPRTGAVSRNRSVQARAEPFSSRSEQHVAE